MRVRQPEDARGSLRWVQALVGGHQPLFERELRAAFGLGPMSRSTGARPSRTTTVPSIGTPAFLALPRHLSVPAQLACRSPLS